MKTSSIMLASASVATSALAGPLGGQSFTSDLAIIKAMAPTKVYIGSLVLAGVSDEVSSKFLGAPAAVVDSAIYESFLNFAKREGIRQSELECARDYSSPCPEDWIDLGSGQCMSEFIFFQGHAPDVYGGSCSPSQSFAGMTLMQKIDHAAECQAKWYNANFAALCPQGWSKSGSVCTAPASYVGKCVTSVDFANYSSKLKKDFSDICAVAWPCA